VLGRRAGATLVTLLVSSLVVYSAMYLAPGDPITLLSGGRPLDPAAKAALAERYHLSDPFLVRYALWLGDALRGDFGRSYVFGDSVLALIRPRAVTTVSLLCYSTLLILVFGTGIGILWALRGRLFALLTTATTAVGLAIPTFVAAVVLTSIFGVDLRWFPVTGSGSGFIGRIDHLTLPAIALAVPAIAYLARMTRTALVRELESEHVVTAIARGLPKGVILRRHVLRNALIPITTVSGITVASLVATSAIVENAFQLDGLGAFLVQSVGTRDFPVVQAICLLFVAAFVLINTGVDLLFRVFDPRIARGG
jgi:peptide/nickel transport system permease protein